MLNKKEKILYISAGAYFYVVLCDDFSQNKYYAHPAV
jgi:hypothetical protein